MEVGGELKAALDPGIMVHPFIGLGPTVSYLHNESLGPSGTTTERNTNNQTGIGGRGELGGIVPVTSILSFGIVANLIINHYSATGTSSSLSFENKSTINQGSIGGLQFIGSIKF